MPEQSSMPSAQICKKQDLLRYQLFLGIAAACLCLGTSIIIDTSGGDPGDRVLIFAVLAVLAAVALFEYSWATMILNRYQKSEKLLLVDIDVQKCL